MKLEAAGLFLPFLRISPLFDVMVGRVEDKGDLLHVAGIGSDVRSIFELEDQLVRIAATRQDHARLVMRGAVMRSHHGVAIHMKHRDHLVRPAFSQPAGEGGIIGDELKARGDRHWFAAFNSGALPRADQRFHFIE